MVNKKRGVFCFIFVILLIGFVSASFNVSNYEVTKDKYSPQNYLEAWAQISFDKEASTSLFETSVGDSFELLKLLELNNFVKTCVPSDCESAYSSDGEGKASLSFSLESGKSKVVGLKFTGSINSVYYVNFSVQSNAGASCKNQLEIDFLADGSVEKGNDKASSEVCSALKNYGCFNSSGESEKLTVEENPYCQKMNLSEAAGFKVGAWVKKGGPKTLEMIVFDKSVNEKARCDLPEPTDLGGEISCDINYTVVKEEEHYVCIKSKSGSTDHQIKSNPSTKCGFFGTPIKAATTAYQIFAQGKKFNSVGTLKIDDSLNGKSIGGDLIESYLLSKYDLDCTDGCVVPIKFTSGYNQDQTITLSNLKGKYRTSSGNPILDEFDELEESPAKISASSQKLYFNQAEFSVTKNMTAYGNETFILKLGEKNIFSKVIFIEKISTIESVSPLFAGAANPTEFVIDVNEKNNSKIINYKWEFGDGTNQTTLVNKTTHTYNEIKDYNLKITITDENGFESSKTFNISVGSPKNIVDYEIKKKLRYVGNLTLDVEILSGFYKESVKEILDLNASKIKLEGLRKNYDNASKEEDYIIIMKELVKLKIPKSIYLVDKIETPFYPLETNIDLDILEAIGAGSYESNLKNDYEKAVSDWVINNLDINLINKNIVGIYEQEGEKDILKIFEIDIEESSGSNYYIVFESLENLEFDKSYSETEEENYIYISASDDENIIFSTTSDVDFMDLPVFISPAISELNVFVPGICNGDDFCDKEAGENWRNCSDCSFSWTILLVIGLLFIIGIVIYIALQIWYKKKYESHLFKDRNSLYNVVQYVHGAKQKGIKEKEVKKNLRKAGWKSEQVTYATKKYKGRETGMWNPFKKRFFKKEA